MKALLEIFMMTCQHHDNFKEQARDRRQDKSVWNEEKKSEKTVETCSALWRDAKLEGVILGSWNSRRKQTKWDKLHGLTEIGAGS